MRFKKEAGFVFEGRKNMFWKIREQILNGGVVSHAAGSGRGCARRGVRRNVQAADNRWRRNELTTPPKREINNGKRIYCKVPH